ncbi:MAG: PKD domain-containing protein [Ferruginibacter sp.]
MVFLFVGKGVFAQYTLNGNASQNDCHCYTLTNDALNQTGSVWNNNKIVLTQSFDFKFDVFLGCADNTGADGIAFVLQPISTSVGTPGNGLGYSGVSPSLGVTIDTWQNGSPDMAGPDGDPYFDHIAIQLNGDLNHKDSIAPLPINNIAGPVAALAGSDNIEDCQWHIFRIKWDAGAKTISAYIDGILRVSAVIDLEGDVFQGDPMVFWGFTGSTGGSKNLQQMCTALKPVFRILADQKKCIGENIRFIDSTVSFAPLQKFYWDFGDGSPIDSINVNPEHTYKVAGNYTVVQAVLGADGCLEINTQIMVIGSVPLADFTFQNACALDSSFRLNDASSATFGTINKWYWDFGNGQTDTARRPYKLFTTPGLKTVKLAVSSFEGCVSDTMVQIIEVYRKPIADFSFNAVQCAGKPVEFTGTTDGNEAEIASWRWNLDSAANILADTKSTSHQYALPGQHIISLTIESINGCAADIVLKTITILPQPVAYFSNTPLCLNTPALFADSSYAVGQGVVSSYWWDLGNGITSTGKDATGTYMLTGDITIRLVVTDSYGCSSDTSKKLISIEAAPIAKFGYELPLCENSATRFSDSSTISSGMINGWNWSFDNAVSSTDQNAVTTFTSGNHRVKLVVQNSQGCRSDTAAATMFINPQPVVDFNVANACKNTNVIFKGLRKPGTDVAQWLWNFDDGTVSTAQDTQHLFAGGGNFPVSLGRSCRMFFRHYIQEHNHLCQAAGNDTIAAIINRCNCRAVAE